MHHGFHRPFDRLRHGSSSDECGQTIFSDFQCEPSAHGLLQLVGNGCRLTIGQVGAHLCHVPNYLTGMTGRSLG